MIHRASNMSLLDSAGRSTPSTGGECSPGDGLKSKSSEGPAITGSANWV